MVGKDSGTLEIMDWPWELVADQMKQQIRAAVAQNNPGAAFGPDKIVDIDNKKALALQFTITINADNGMRLNLTLLQYYIGAKNANKGFIIQFTTLTEQFEKQQKTFEESAMSMRID